MFFKILLIILLIILLTVGFSTAKIIGLFREGARQFKEQMNGQGHQQQQRQQRPRNNEQVIVDQRDEEDINKKIFNKDEGEYVDFEEEAAEPTEEK